MRVDPAGIQLQRFLVVPPHACSVPADASNNPLDSMLDMCRLKRRDADYEIERTFLRPTSATAVKDCREIIVRADAF